MTDRGGVGGAPGHVRESFDACITVPTRSEDTSSTGKAVTD